MKAFDRLFKAGCGRKPTELEALYDDIVEDLNFVRREIIDFADLKILNTIGQELALLASEMPEMLVPSAAKVIPEAAPAMAIPEAPRPKITEVPPPQVEPPSIEAAPAGIEGDPANWRSYPVLSRWVETLAKDELIALEYVLGLKDRTLWQRTDEALNFISRSEKKEISIIEIIKAAVVLKKSNVKGLPGLLARISVVNNDGSRRSPDEIRGASRELIILGRLQAEASGNFRLTWVNKNLGSIEFHPESIGAEGFQVEKYKVNQDIDADGYRGQIQVMIEVKSCLRSEGLNFKLKGGISNNDEEILRFRNQARKYAEALKKGTIKGIEYHLVMPVVDEEVIRFLRETIGAYGRISVYRYSTLADTTGETVLNWEPPPAERKPAPAEPKSQKSARAWDEEAWAVALSRYSNDFSGIKHFSGNPVNLHKKLRHVHSQQLIEGLKRDLNAVATEDQTKRETIARLKTRIEEMAPLLMRNSVSVSAICDFSRVLRTVLDLII